jgi:hypothetical protein
MMTSKVWVVVATDARRRVCELSSCVLRDWRLGPWRSILLSRSPNGPGLPLTAFYGFAAARLRGERRPAAVLQAALVALIGGFLIALKALLH